MFSNFNTAKNSHYHIMENNLIYYIITVILNVLHCVVRQLRQKSVSNRVKSMKVMIDLFQVNSQCKPKQTRGKKSDFPLETLISPAYSINPVEQSFPSYIRLLFDGILSGVVQPGLHGSNFPKIFFTLYNMTATMLMIKVSRSYIPPETAKSQISTFWLSRHLFLGVLQYKRYKKKPPWEIAWNASNNRNNNVQILRQKILCRTHPLHIPTHPDNNILHVYITRLYNDANPFVPPPEFSLSMGVITSTKLTEGISHLLTSSEIDRNHCGNNGHDGPFVLPCALLLLCRAPTSEPTLLHNNPQCTPLCLSLITCIYEFTNNNNNNNNNHNNNGDGGSMDGPGRGPAGLLAGTGGLRLSEGGDHRRGQAGRVSEDHVHPCKSSSHHTSTPTSDTIAYIAHIVSQQSYADGHNTVQQDEATGSIPVGHDDMSN